MNIQAFSSIESVEARIRELEGQMSALDATAIKDTSSKSFKAVLQQQASPSLDLPPALSTTGKVLNPNKTMLHQLINQVSDAHGIDPTLVQAIVQQESGFNPNAISKAGAQGLMQLMPATAKHLGVEDALDPVQNVTGGVKYLKQLLGQYQGNIPLALAAYNAGSGAIQKYGGIPPYSETQHYVKTILGHYLKQKQTG